MTTRSRPAMSSADPERRGPDQGRGPARGPGQAREPDRARDPERTRREILDVALSEFARNGYSGARVDEIAAKTRTTKRMIYYYFTNKEQLYIAVHRRRMRRLPGDQLTVIRSRGAP